MKRKTSTLIFIAALAAALITIPILWTSDTESASNEQNPAPQPTLTVTVTSPREARLPVRISANGNITAWQEASVGTEANGLRLIDVKVNVGDKVQRGQVLAVFASDTIDAELAQSRAAVSEADVALAEAAANAERARALQGTGALSAQQIQQTLNTERSVKARLDAARALEKIQQLRLEQTNVLAPDDGIISARAATVGAVVPAGEELFRLIRQGRIEWRAEVAAAELAKLKPGQEATVIPVGGEPIRGTLRMVGPMVDTQTRNGLVYVDLPSSENVRVGMFARGEFEIASGTALVLPQSAVLLRDGFSYVLHVDADSRIIQTKIKTGRRIGDQVEILGGIGESAQVVAAGGGFLGDGDLVRVVTDKLTPHDAEQFSYEGAL
jgi:RND family efflux transporter MFP subunit